MIISIWYTVFAFQYMYVYVIQVTPLPYSTLFFFIHPFNISLSLYISLPLSLLFLLNYEISSITEVLLTFLFIFETGHRNDSNKESIPYQARCFLYIIILCLFQKYITLAEPISGLKVTLNLFLHTIKRALFLTDTSV